MAMMVLAFDRVEETVLVVVEDELVAVVGPMLVLELDE